MKHVGKLLPKELKVDSYTEQLQTKEWHDFSQRVRARFHGACVVCRRKDVATQVHHKFYDFNRKVWEYDEDEVMLVCAGCHDRLHKELMDFRRTVMAWLRPEEFKMMNAALRIALQKYDSLTFVHALHEFVGNESLLKRYAQSFGKADPYKPDANPGPIYNATEREYDEHKQTRVEGTY